jgi:hypothetical protein
MNPLGKSSSKNETAKTEIQKSDEIKNLALFLDEESHADRHNDGIANTVSPAMLVISCHKLSSTGHQNAAIKSASETTRVTFIDQKNHPNPCPRSIRHRR